jgi:hypothetical protein
MSDGVDDRTGHPADAALAEFHVGGRRGSVLDGSVVFPGKSG